MSVFNRKMFKPRNARNALSMSAGIMPVQKFNAGGLAALKRFNHGGSVHMGTRSRTMGTTSNRSGLPGVYTAPKFTGSLARANVGELAQRYISGKPLTASELSVLRGAEQGFLSGQGLNQSMGQFGKTRLGSGIKSILNPMAQAGGNIRGFVEGATGTAAKTLLGSSDGSMPADKAAGPQLNKDYLESLGIDFLDPANLQTASSRGGPVPPSAFGKAVPPPAAPKSQEELDADAMRAAELNKEEAAARAEMDRIGSVVGNEEAELSPTGFLPTTTPSLESATDNALTTSDSSPEPVDQMFMGFGDAPPPEGDGTSTSTTKGGADGTDGSDGAPTGEEEIKRVINNGTQEEKQSTLDGFIKEFMDKAPGYEGADSGLILAKIGFAMAAGKSPRAIENIASAMSDGADMLIKDKAKKDEFNRQLKLSAMQYGFTETGKLRAEDRLEARERRGVKEMVVGAGGTTYKNKKYKENESIFVDVGDIRDGKMPENITNTATLTALANQAKAANAVLKQKLDAKTISLTEYQKQVGDYRDAVTTAITSEVGIGLLEGAMVNTAEGEVTGISPAVKDMLNKGGNFFGMDLGKEYETLDDVRNAMKASLQDLIPVTLGASQSANSISNRDVDFLIEAYFGAGALTGGSLAFATTDTDQMVKRLQRASEKMRDAQKGAFATMNTVTNTLTPVFQPGTQQSAVGGLSIEQQRLAKSGLGTSGTTTFTSIGATRGDDGVIRLNLS